MAEPLVTELLDAALERRRMVFEALSLLIPFDLPQERKVRIGAPGRGGWVLVDRLRTSQPVLSFVLGSSVAFEQAMAERGHDVWLMSPTVGTDASSVAQAPGVRRRRESVAGRDAAEQGTFSLASHMNRLPADGDAAILKLDIEGGEWDVLAAIDRELLARFEQIALSIHFRQQIGNPAFNGLVQSVLRKLAGRFTLCHVHADPLAEIRILGGFPVLASAELTYVRSDVVQRAPSATIYPTAVDGSSGLDHWPEQVLWFYPFAPGSAAMGLPDDLEVRPPALALSTTTDAVALNNAGLALHGLGRLNQALRHFDRALTLTPGVAGILYNRGNTLVSMRRLDEAIESYDAALLVTPDDVALLNNRACALGALYRFDEALANLDRAASLQPADPTTLTNRQVLQQARVSTTAPALTAVFDEAKARA